MKTATRKRTPLRLSLSPETRANTGHRWIYHYNSAAGDNNRNECWVVQCVLAALNFSYAVAITRDVPYDLALLRVRRMRNAMLRFYGTEIPD